MKIVRYDDNGVITQVVMQVEMGMETLSDKYAEMGIPHILYDGEVDVANAYVKDGAITPKPPVVVTGDIRTIKADGSDALHLKVTPAEFDATVALGGAVIHREHITSGDIEFSVDHPGNYTIAIAAAHPYSIAKIEVEVMA